MSFVTLDRRLGSKARELEKENEARENYFKPDGNFAAVREHDLLAAYPDIYSRVMFFDISLHIGYVDRFMNEKWRRLELDR